MKPRGKSLIVKFLCLLLALFLFISPLLYQPIKCLAGGMYNSLNDDSKSNAALAWQWLLSNGYTEEAAAGIMGNIDQESTFTPNFAGGSYQGAFQMSIDQVTACKTWCAENGFEAESMVGQLEYLSKCNWETSFSTYGKKIGLDAFKALTDIDEATNAFCAAYERCVGGESTEENLYNGTYYQELGKRREYARDIYEKLTGSVAPSNDGMKTSSKTNTTLVTALGESRYDMSYFIGEDKLAKDSAIYLTGRDDLSYRDKTELSNWINDTSSAGVYAPVKFFRALIAFVGILIVVYSSLLYVFYWFDRVNNFIDLDLLSVVTFGRLTIAPDDKTSTFNKATHGKKAIVHRDIIFICITGISIGVLLLSGRVYLMISWIINTIKELTT